VLLLLLTVSFLLELFLGPAQVVLLESVQCKNLILSLYSMSFNLFTFIALCLICFLFLVVNLAHLDQLAVSGETHSAPRGKTQRSRVAPQPLTNPKTELKPYTLLNSGGSPKPKGQEFKFPPPSPPIHRPSEGILSFLDMIIINNN
jgi:hypothetical protein